QIGDGGAGGDGFLELERGGVEDVGDAGGGVDAVERGAGVGEALEAGLGAGVSGGVGWIHEAAGVVDERMIDAPSVHADGGEGGAAGQGGDGGGESGADLAPEAGDVPVVVAVEGLKGVGKAVDLAEGELPVFPGAEDDAAAGGAEIDGGGVEGGGGHGEIRVDRKSTRLNSSHVKISYAAFC